MVTRLYVSNFIKQILTFDDNSNFVFFNFIKKKTKKKRIRFFKLSSCFFYFNYIPRIPTPIPRIPIPISRIPLLIPRIPTLITTLRSPILHSGFYRQPVSEIIRGRRYSFLLSRKNVLGPYEKNQQKCPCKSDLNYPNSSIRPLTYVKAVQYLWNSEDILHFHLEFNSWWRSLS